MTHRSGARESKQHGWSREIAKPEGVETRVMPRFLNILGDVSGLVTLDAGRGLRDHSLHLRS